MRGFEGRLGRDLAWGGTPLNLRVGRREAAGTGLAMVLQGLTPLNSCQRHVPGRRCLTSKRCLYQRLAASDGHAEEREHRKTTRQGLSEVPRPSKPLVERHRFVALSLSNPSHGVSSKVMWTSTGRVDALARQRLERPIDDLAVSPGTLWPSPQCVRTLQRCSNGAPTVLQRVQRLASPPPTTWPGIGCPPFGNGPTTPTRSSRSRHLPVGRPEVIVNGSLRRHGIFVVTRRRTASS